MSVFEFTDTRSAKVPHRIIGENKLDGVLIVDRYPAYNKMQVQLQYCYAHLSRDIEKLEHEFIDDEEVKKFTSNLIPLVATAMGLRGQETDDKQYYLQAQITAQKIKLQMRIIHLLKEKSDQQ